MEMNLHMPQDPESESELRNLAAIPYQIISPANNAPIIGIFQDSMLGSYQFTRSEISFTPKEAMTLLMQFKKSDPEIFKQERISNFDILSQILPPMSLKVKNKQYGDNDDPKTSNNVIEIMNGKYLRGQIDKGILGSGTKGLIQRICNDYGNMASSLFIDDLQNIVTEYMKSSSFSVGISDLITDKATNDEIISLITDKKIEVKNLIQQVQLGIFENTSGKTNEEEFETRVNNILGKGQNEAGKVALNNLSKNNRFVTMFNAGSKGTEINIQQMTVCLGQQNVDGKRIPYGFDHRTLPHYTKFDDSPVARGFVESSYINGMSPQEVFFHAMGGRIGLIDTAVKTSTTGYIQRRLVKSLEDAKVNYDMTVRNNKNKIIQFSFGEDSMDTVKIENQDFPIADMNIQEIYGHFMLMEIENKTKNLSNIFIANKYKLHKQENETFIKKATSYAEEMINNRKTLISNVFNNKLDKVVRAPVAFSYIIQNIMGQQHINSNSLVDLTMLEAYDLIEHAFRKLETIHFVKPTPLFRMLYFYYLSPKDLLINKRFNQKSLQILLENVILSYKRSIVSPGEMVGIVAAQSIGEPTTQMSLLMCEHIWCQKINKLTKNVNSVIIKIGELCDKIIEDNPHMTFNTGHVNSVETLLDELEDEYYIIGVDGEEKTHWNKISHISRHPVNGGLVKVTTKSGREVTTTLSHSHLIRNNNTVEPIRGDQLQVGMRIPVAKKISNDFVETYVQIGSKRIELNNLLGWFVGAYLAEGNISNYNICITNVADNYINNTTAIADMFGKKVTVRRFQGEYGPSVHTSFSCKELALFLLETCDTGSFVKRVPDFAFTSPLEFKSGLLQGYMDGDGNFQCDERHHQIRACSRSERLAKDLALMFNYFGIFSSINVQNHKQKPLYNLSISAKYARLYRETIGSTLHINKLNGIVDYNERGDAHNLSDEVDKINGLGDIIATCGKVLKLPGQSRTYGRWKNKQTIGRRTLKKYIDIFEAHENRKLIENELNILNQAEQSDVIWDEIVNIEVRDPEENENLVYDFTVPMNQTFMTHSGVIVHNTLNSFTYETEIIVRNSSGIIEKVEMGKFIQDKISICENKEYYADKDTTYAPLSEYYEIPSCDENGSISWKRIEAVTQHPVINKDGTNTMLKVTTKEQREVIATKAKSFLKLINGKIHPINGDELKVGDYLPVSTKPIDFTETTHLNLKELLPPTEYIYASEVEKAKNVINEYHWWSKHSGKTFTLPYKRSDSFVAKISDKIRKGSKTKTTFEPNCVYMLQSNMNNYQIPENIELNYNFGYLIGAYASEGSMTKFQMSIANNDNNYFGPIIELCEQWNITTKIHRNENKGQEGWTSQDIRIYNTLLCRLLEILCGKLSHNKFVHSKIIFSNKQCILGFLDAYIGGDGCVDVRCKSISASSVSKKLLIDVQQMFNIMGVSSFITKYKKRMSNNRGTLPENIHQLYTLNCIGNQIKQLIPHLNIKLQYKQDNLQCLMEHDYLYEINKYSTVIPDEIDGEIIIRNKENGEYDELIFDRIISIEEVPNTTNYAYDLTVVDTRNFNTYNGLAVLDTFHFAGVASKSNVTRGVPRIEELLSLHHPIKNPSLTIYLKAEDEGDKQRASVVQYMIEHTKLSEVVKSIGVCFDPDDMNTLINEDREIMAQFNEFEKLISECAEFPTTEACTDKSKWIIRMEMDPEIMLEKNITMDDVNFALTNSYGNEIHVAYSDYNSEKLIFRIRMDKVVEKSESKKNKGPKINPLDQSDQIYIIKGFQEQLMNTIVLRGIKNIKKVILRKVKDNLTEKAGGFVKNDVWVLDTVGTNFIDVLGLDYIDSNKTMSNDVLEVYNVLGMEAARQCLYNEMSEVLEFDGAYVNAHHISLLCDRMTHSHKMVSVFRHGINNDDIGPIAKASFEETPEMFLKAARHAELDTLRGISANIMCGQEGLYGTSAFQLVLDLNEMGKLEEKYKYEHLNANKIIDREFMANIDEVGDCSIQQLTINTNIANLRQVEMNYDETYNPFE
jgi:DNA-directed RNA polymerase beta' subunit